MIHIDSLICLLLYVSFMQTVWLSDLLLSLDGSKIKTKPTYTSFVFQKNMNSLLQTENRKYVNTTLALPKIKMYPAAVTIMSRPTYWKVIFKGTS